jgi:tetratricopeptide (TPR) repeat protein
MYCLLRFLSLIIGFVGICAAPAAAQQDPDWQACNIADPKTASDIDTKIAGCAHVLDRAGSQTARNRAIALANRGLAYQNRGDVDRAIADFSEVTRIDPDFPNWRYARATQYANGGDFTLAIADFSEAIRLRPNTAAYLNGRGRAYEKIGDLANALIDFRTALSLDPNAPDAGEAIRRIEGKLAATREKPATSAQQAFSSKATMAEMLVCNKSSAPEINVAVGFYDDVKGWTSVGWSAIPRNLCVHPMNLFATSNGNQFNISNFNSYYLYGTKDDREWGASEGQQGAFFCVDPAQNSFTLYNKEYIRAADGVLDCAAHGLVAENFRQIIADSELSYTFDDVDASRIRDPVSNPQAGSISPADRSCTRVEWDWRVGAWVCKR